MKYRFLPYLPALICCHFAKEASLQDVIGNLSCNFREDTCGWQFSTDVLDEIPNPEGWVIFSRHLDGDRFRHYSSPVGSRFLLAHANTAMRSRAISPPFRNPDDKVLRMNFEYFADNDTKLAIFVLAKEGNETGHSYESFLWSTPEKRPTPEWKNIDIPFLCHVTKDAEEFRISFVVFLSPGCSAGLANITTTTMTQSPEECRGRPPEGHSGVLQFIVVFFIFLLFGSLFLTAILMLSRRHKSAAEDTNVVSTFQNPAFEYRKLGRQFRTHPTIPEDDAEL